MLPMSTEESAVPEFDQFAPAYDELLQDPLRVGFASDPLHFCKRKWWVLNRMLQKLGRSAGTMAWLDVGCGRGEFLEFAGSHFADAVGCDPSAKMLSSARFFSMVQQTHPSDLPFPSRSFDLVTAVCVYHHVRVSARPALTREILRVLRPGGLFCLIEHNPHNPVTCRIVNRCPVDADAELLSLRESMEMARESGFRADVAEYFLYLPEKWFHRFSWIEAGLRGVPLGGQYTLLAHANHS